ncbi:Ulp1-like peptidase [Cucumis melo var. makuwa]|uniref:Ulp1-like peptidase n=1 Tax=Cucumis melo var. makuwa TaxID=1194695 RepID=A0A5A7U0R3_CUCMM|nr:Ulp1-like peptidase [Cucumis melo var. makuwa]
MDTGRPIGAIEDKVGWLNVNYVIGCINIKEHWMTLAADLKKCKIYVFDSMPNYIEQRLVDEAVAIPARCIPSLANAIGIPVQRKCVKYGPWLVIMIV